MRSFFFLLGAITFPSGMMHLYSLIGKGQSVNDFLLIRLIFIATSLVFIAVIIDSTLRGWREKDLKAITKMSLGLLVIKVVFIVIFGKMNFFGQFLGMPNADTQWVGWLLLIWITLNIAAYYVYPTKPTKGMLWSWIIANIALGLVMTLLVMDPENATFTHTAILVLSRTFIVGLLILFTIRHYALKNKWPEYIEKGEIAINPALESPIHLNDQERMERLAHPQLMVRVAAAETLRYSESPEAIAALARAVEGAPILYLLEAQTVASGWKALKMVAADSLGMVKSRNQPFVDAYPQVYCTRDHRWAIKEKTPGGTEYVLCPVCRKHDAFTTGFHHVIGWIGLPDSPNLAEGTLGLQLWDNTSQTIMPADISELAIFPETLGQHADWAVSAFVQHFQNDIRNEGRKIPVSVKNPSTLSANTLVLLNEIQLKDHEPQ